jgi:hypothetical protein
MLRRSGTTVLAFLAICLFAGQNVTAQRTVRLNSTPSAFRTFYREFARAVNKGEIAKLAGMTSFPFSYGFDAGDEGVWNRKQFVAKAGGFLMPQPLVFLDKNPEFTTERGAYTLTNGDDASYFTFKKKGRTYKFVSYIAEP